MKRVMQLIMQHMLVASILTAHVAIAAITALWIHEHYYLLVFFVSEALVGAIWLISFRCADKLVGTQPLGL